MHNPLSHMKRPPLKIQGIKIKIIPYIKKHLIWDESKNTWIEPFLGSGSVVFNMAPKNAILGDSNKFIIHFYGDIQKGIITPEIAEKHLLREGKNLEKYGEDHYYNIRERFNKNHDSLDFLFLNRSCFNGLMRFNNEGHFNTPFCRNKKRFSNNYIRKIVNQISWVIQVMKGKNWEFFHQDWRKTLEMSKEGDVIYVDPPYIGRFTKYYNEFSLKEGEELAKTLIKENKNFIFSMWYEDKKNKNSFVDKWFKDYKMVKIDHAYFVGSKNEYRDNIVEVLIFSPNIFV